MHLPWPILLSLPQTDDFNKRLLDEANRITDHADRRNVTLRLLGSIAFRLHCPKFVHYLDRLDRKLTDVDFASYTKERESVEKILSDLGYVTQSYALIAAATLGRSIYWKSDDKELKVDIFWDRLSMNHTINFERRLELDKPTIPLSEMLQEKLQIVKLNMKDVKDTVVLLLEHDVTKNGDDREKVDLAPILKQASNDWGYYYTFTLNLSKIREHLQGMDVFSAQERATIDESLAKILESLETVPKSLAWKLRARVGSKTKWYNEVE